MKELLDKLLTRVETAKPKESNVEEKIVESNFAIE
jgi:hypothetical protein